MSDLIAMSICMGTACYLSGSNDLFRVKDLLPAEISQRLLITGSPCLRQCTDRIEGMSPPFVHINGHVYGSMNLLRLEELLRAYD